MSDYDRIWIGITPEQYRDLYNAMGGDGAWQLHSCWTDEDSMEQDTTWCLAGRCEAILKNRTRMGEHSFFLAVCSEREL